MSNLELRIDESSDLSFHAVDFVGVPFAPTVEVEDIEGGHRVSITSMGAEGKKTDEFDVMDGADGATWLSGNILIGELSEGTVLTADDAFAAPPKSVEVYGKSTQDGTPTPDAPVAIQSVTPNLLCDDFGTWVKGKLIQSDGSTANNGAYMYNEGYVPVQAGLTYTLFFNKVATPATVYGSAACYDSSKAIQSRPNTFTAQAATTGLVWCTFTVPVGTSFVRVNIANNATGVAMYEGLVTPAYVPHGHVAISTNGRNLLDPRMLKGAYYSVTADGMLTVLANDNSTWETVPIRPLSAGTYTLSRSDASGLTTIRMYSASGALVGARNITNGTASDTFTAPAGTAFARIKVGVGTSSYPFTTAVQLERGSVAHDFEPCAHVTIPIDLGGRSLRSLPDGTRDTLTLSYIGPSTEHEGWGVFSAELVQRVSYVDDVTTLSVNGFNGSGASPYITFNISIASNRGINSTTVNTMATAHQGRILSNQSPCIYVTGNGGSLLIGDSRFSGLSQSEAVELLQGESVQYALATPITHDLGTIELPVNPAPDLTAWADGGSAQPTLAMEYERALSIVIPRIEAAISDLATS